MIVILVMGSLWFGYVQWQIHAFHTFMTRETYDAGIVLGAALWNDYPSPGLRERLDHALGLYEKGTFSHFIVSGGLDQNGSTLTEAEGMKRYLTEKGVPPERIVLEDQSKSTYENIKYSHELMKRRQWETAILVTHGYHGARALDIARFVGLKDPGVSTTDSKVMSMAWHSMRESLAYTKWKLEKMLMSLGVVGR